MIGRSGIVELDGNRWLTLAIPLAGDGDRMRMLAVLQASRTEAPAAYRPWWQSTAQISFLVLVVGFAGAWLLARGVVRPVRMLSEQAESIAEGDYGREISLEGRAARGGEIGELIDSFRRMQSAIAEREDSIRYNAYHEATTGLINRHRLELLIDRRLQDLSVERTRCAVVTIGLNGFREINETLGYHVGDRLLRSFAAWLDETVGDRGMKARLGGDEFGLFLADVSVASLEREIERLVDGIGRPFHEEGLTLHLAFKMGVAIHPEHGRDAAMPLRQADAARFSARKKGVSHEIFSGSQDRYSLLRISLLGGLQAAMSSGDICLHFQPKLDMKSDSVREMEALLRWDHPTYVPIPPQDFIPMIEHTGNIHMVTMWVIKRVLRQMAAWSEEGLEVDISVNISAKASNPRPRLNCCAAFPASVHRGFISLVPCRPGTFRAGWTAADTAPWPGEALREPLEIRATRFRYPAVRAERGRMVPRAGSRIPGRGEGRLKRCGAELDRARPGQAGWWQ